MKISLSCEFKSCLFLSVLFFPEGSTERVFLTNIETIVREPYERCNAAAALQQVTFMVAQRLSVFKAVLVSR